MPVHTIRPQPPQVSSSLISCRRSKHCGLYTAPTRSRRAAPSAGTFASSPLISADFLFKRHFFFFGLFPEELCFICPPPLDRFTPPVRGCFDSFPARVSPWMIRLNPLLSLVGIWLEPQTVPTLNRQPFSFTRIFLFFRNLTLLSQTRGLVRPSSPGYLSMGPGVSLFERLMGFKVFYRIGCFTRFDIFSLDALTFHVQRNYSAS